VLLTKCLIVKLKLTKGITFSATQRLFNEEPFYSSLIYGIIVFMFISTLTVNNIQHKEYSHV
jgi:hypothetical protein